MADTVNITPGTGAVIGTDEVTIGGVLQHVQRTKLIDGSDGGTTPITAFPAGYMRVSDEPRQLFYDPFDATLDTTNVWTATNGNSGVLPAASSGSLSLGTGTTANGWSKLTAIPTFKPTVPAWLGWSAMVILPDLVTPTANSYRFIGMGTTPTTPSTTTPITDGIGFEVSTSGKMYAVVYAAGVRTVVQDLSATGNSKQPADANGHRYIIFIRTDKIYWYIDGLADSNLVATSNFQAPSVQTLSPLFLAVGGATPPTSNTQIQSSGVAVWDTGKNNTQISDATYPWRRVEVGKEGGLSVKGAISTPQTSNMGSAGVFTTPAYDVSEAGNVSFIVKNTVAGTAWGGTPTMSFEQSDDGVSWAPLTVVRNDNGYAAANHNLGAGAANASIVLEAAVESVSYVRCSKTSAANNGVTVVIQGGGMPFSPAVSAINGNVKNTYRGVTSTLLTTATTANVPFFTIVGSSSKTVKIQRIRLFGLTLTAVAYLQVNLARYSTAATGGTSTNLGRAQMDTNMAISTLTNTDIKVYTAAPTAGTKVIDLATSRVLAQATTAAAGGAPPTIDFDFRAVAESSPIVLRGINDFVGLYYPVAPATAVSMMLEVEWTEE